MSDCGMPCWLIPPSIAGDGVESPCVLRLGHDGHCQPRSFTFSESWASVALWAAFLLLLLVFP